MKSRKIFPRLTPLVLAALLLNFPGASAAQRRRRPARTPARPAAPAPTRTIPARTTPTPAPQTTTLPHAQATPAPPRPDAPTPRPEPARAPAARKPAPGETNARGAGRGAAEKGADAQGFAVRRYGRLLLAADSPFTLKRLRGEEGAPALADNARFQSVRSRFGSDSVFVYVDTTLAQQGYAVNQEKAQEAREAGEKQPGGQVEVAVTKPEE